MSHVIAVAGKGGVGKTTLCGLLIQYLCEQKKGPILAVDADANSNLNEVLGVEVEATLGDIREEIARAETAKENPIPAGVSKADYAEFKFNSASQSRRETFIPHPAPSPSGSHQRQEIPEEIHEPAPQQHYERGLGGSTCPRRRADSRHGRFPA